MRNCFIGLVIVGASAVIPQNAIATSWFSSVNRSSFLLMESLVCTKVNPTVSNNCQNHRIFLDKRGKLDIKPHLFNHMTNLMIPQWDVVGQKVHSKAQHPEIINVALQEKENPLASDTNADFHLNKLATYGKIQLQKYNFPKISRSSLLGSSVPNNFCFSTKSSNCSSVEKFNFSHPAPETTRVSSSFGWRRRPYSGRYQFHKGIDYGAPLGSPVVAAADGIVTKVVSGCLDFRNRWCGNQFGNWVEIDHGNGAVALYGHLLHKSITVKEGMKVWKNQEIAQVGSSGWSTGAHLDFRVKVNGQYKNPRNFVY
ncbi:MAG: M23 family metallopeptidase [Xenococcaceae cyanobacterium MO_207.B15]|nr:M23 family metallopeptidase [Xenococcaceae cyanobacterium MO_207.B15]